jgi:carbon monoxide dehydrogenase subunit G
MIKAESQVKELDSDMKEVFGFLSNLKNLEPHIPADKVRNFKAEENSCSFQVDMIGDATINIVDKEPYKSIKFSGNKNTSFPFDMWVQLKESTPGKTFMKLTLHAEVNMMMKMIVEPILKNGVETIADKITGFINSQKD